MINLAPLQKTLYYFLAGSLIFHTALSQADDTEIFFSSPDTSVGLTKPNVLFILDNSGSMNWALNNNNNATGGAKSRMTVLKESFSDILGNTSGINAGIMVLNARGEYGNSRFVYPVTDIDEAVPSGNQVVANTGGIRVSGDDATQSITPLGTAVIDSPTLVMGQISVSNTLAGNATHILGTGGIFFRKTVSGAEYACRMNSSGLTRNTGTPCRNEPTYTTFSLNGQEVLFNFDGMEIPAGATITDAYISMTPSNTLSGGNNTRNPSVSVRIESNKAPATLNDNNLIGSRTYLNTASIATSGGWTNGTPVQVDVTTQLRQVLGVAPVGDPVTGLLARLSINSTNAYTICTAGSCIPRLVVNYTTTSTSNQTRLAALRFQDVAIPQGATINSASISFVPAATSAAGTAAFDVQAENTGNAAIFIAGSNLTTRTKTTAVTWNAPAWTATATPSYVEGPDVTSLVQNLVSRTDWCGNNAMSFHITPQAGNTSTRVAYSIDGAGGLQPVLNISYSGGNSGCLNPIIELRVNAEKDDAYQSNGGSVSVAGNTLALSRAMIGARFEQVRVKRGANVLDAELIVTPSNTVANPGQTSTIGIENADSSAGFVSESNNLGSRSRISGGTCSYASWTAGQPVSCTSATLISGLQTLFARSGWAANNPMSIFLSHSSDSTQTAVAYEQNPSRSIKLRIKLRNGDLADQGTVTVRDDMIARVNSMFAQDGTPIVPTMFDAARYLRNSTSRPTPITSSCQPTHVVLLTDGQANGNTTAAKNGIGSIVGSNCTGDATDDGEQCARTLATFLANNDQLSDLAGDNKITTHTVGFALDASGATASANIRRFLQDIATNGGGSFNSAENAGELTKAFNKIIGEVLATDTTFVSATAPVNTFNRQDNKDELYFSLFRPAATDRWLGNLKRYRMDTSSGSAIIVDRDGSPAIDTNSGYFKTSARSWWTPSGVVDGSQVAAGGAASQLPAPESRNLLTNVTPGSNALTAISVNNAALDATKLGAANATEREALITYIRGYSEGTERKTIGDPIHSTPSLITYGATTQSAIIGTNEGFVQMFDTQTGREQFAFMPAPLLQNIKRLAANAATSVTAGDTGSHPYGMDNTVTVWSNDADGNGTIESSKSEFVYAYATMGRGGRNIYALDITSPTSPRLMWSILGGSTAGFSKLGQTWSAPVKAKIKVGNDITDVLVFGGGYDPAQDAINTDGTYSRKVDSQGNALYVVNAKTGTLIWSASSSSGHTVTLPDMKYSIPSGVAVVGLTADSAGNPYIDTNGLAQQIFVGDMGGQVWRFLIDNGKSGASLITGGVFASIAGNSGTDARRFYHEPEIAVVSANNRPNLTVNIGSGYRGHPLNKTIQDRFYSFRTQNIASLGSTLTEADLYDATSITSTASAAQKTAILEKSGWYIRFTRSGEKVLSRPLVAAGELSFNTYEPEVNLNGCKAAPGTTRAYRVNLFDSSAANGLTRYVVTKGSSLPSNPQIYCKGNACWVYNDPSQLVSGNGSDDDGGGDEACANAANPEKCRCDRNPICVWMPSTPRSYWIDEE